ncbi:hypothetical protein [Tessaracoccus antarcticus]|uniref:Uncharacterized protein n=1 Tax=Tessaracoccus antarcticus TaxID=2479848 RepID=A0A3M0GBR2_9ACTN|nr:hypothetical protein [Tessaracoccus antarcticus]RMB62334.1 hypothetical protein EAX62_07215 [Tessaracoccus antarcticus]
MKRTEAVVRMHFSRRFSAFFMPPILGVGVVLIMVVVVWSLGAAGVSTSSPEVVDGFRNNGGIVWTLAGFLLSLGVQAATSCFAFATSLGTTRRDYVVGTGMYFVLQTLYVTAILATLLALEKVTGHWFINAYSLDVRALGSGDWGAFLLVVLSGALSMQAVGAMFGASWLRFGSRGPLLISAVLVAVLVGAILIIIPRWAAVVAAFSMVWVSLVLIILGAVSLMAAGAFLRRTTVRGT